MSHGYGKPVKNQKGGILMSITVRSIYHYVCKDSGVSKLTDDEELAKFHDPFNRLASKLDLIEYYTDTGDIFDGFLNTYDGLVIWRAEDDEGESGYELLKEKDLPKQATA